MPRDSISRRVARAAATGGSKSYKSRTPYGWYAVLMAVCVVGLALVVYSRHEMLATPTTTASTTTTTTQPNAVPPTTDNHWQVALAVDVCGTVVNLPKSSAQQSGLTTPGDGIVNIQPAAAGADAAQFEGHNATLGKFLTQEGVTLGDSFLNLPHSTGKVSGSYNNGDKCEGSPGVVAVSIWSTPTATVPFKITSDATDLQYANGEMFMISFLPKGAKVPVPPAKSLVEEFLRANPSGTVATATTTTTTPGATSSTTSSVPGASSSTTTTSAGSTTSSTAATTTTTPSTTTTTKG